MLKIDVKTSEKEIVLDVEFNDLPTSRVVISKVIVRDDRISIDEKVSVGGYDKVTEVIERVIERKDGLIAEFIEKGIDILSLRAVALEKEEREKHELS